MNKQPLTEKTKLPCDDCKTPTPLEHLDAWAAVESRSEADAHLCKRCHEARGPSAWGPWAPLAT